MNSPFVEQRTGRPDGTAERCRQRAPRRALLGLVIGLLTALGLSAVAPGIAHAENSVVNSSPATGASRDVAPEEVVITFTEELGDVNTIDLSCEAEQIPLSEPEVGDDGLLLTAQILEPVGRGTCAIRWQVTNTDGEANGEGTITFSVTNDPVAEIVDESDDGTETDTPDTTVAPIATPATDTDGDDEIVVTDFSTSGGGQGPVWLGRLLSTLSIAALFGGLVLITTAWPEGVEYLVTVKFLRGVWVVALISTLLFTAAATAASTGRGLGSGFSPTAWIDLLDAGWAGRAVILRLVFVIGSAWVAFRPDRAIDPTTQIAGLGIPALAVAMTGVTRTLGDLAAIGVLVGIVHALAMAVWLGGVILLARVVLSGPGEEDLVHAVRGFGRVSIVAIIVTVVSGVIQLIRLDGGALFDSGHGRVLLLKSIVVAVMIFLAITARQFVAQRLARAHEMSVPLADRLRRAFGAEAGIGVVILALSSWMLALSPPNIDTTPRIPYKVTTSPTFEGSDLDVRLSFTDDVAGLVGIEVDVRGPAEGISNLSLVLTAPPNDRNIGTITQAIPLTGTGRAVRLEAQGLPLDIPGAWEVRVDAIVGGAQVSSIPQTLNINNADGTQVTTVVTFPEANIVTVPESTVAPADG
ncbi:copper resistance CopC/CopD family protein [Ilumatobacter coccineus]|uniref:Putative copper resistance protein n=1 Tax=Ilumatobacter coccineus (strain NBRC 103263 / KCTC 29153 / YM16-304) TaxID=1313172 RepID=A0A6C7EDG4_ILUCY|nr:CopD family protein [Ilumatobacter coccineus]BAN04032.1 putative copper resistance protein [Ilumatobacter coccineus YM16-304]